MRSDASTPESSDESLSFLSNDPLTNFSIPMALRKHSAELNNFTTELEDRIEEMSALFAEPLNNDLEVARERVALGNALGLARVDFSHDSFCF